MFAYMAMSQAIHRNEEPRLGPGKMTGEKHGLAPEVIHQPGRRQA